MMSILYKYFLEYAILPLHFHAQILSVWKIVHLSHADVAMFYLIVFKHFLIELNF